MKITIFKKVNYKKTYKTYKKYNFFLFFNKIIII